MEAAGTLSDVPVRVVTGPEEYLFGEEKALLEVIEGNEPLPRWLPPYIHGLYATSPQLGWQSHEPEPGHHGAHDTNPTLVNNVETLANVPGILTQGAEWFRSRGTANSPGTVVCTVIGDIVRPGVVEVELGTPLADVLDRCGGPLPGRALRAAFSGRHCCVEDGHTGSRADLGASGAQDEGDIPVWARRGPSDGRPSCARLRPTQQSQWLTSILVGLALACWAAAIRARAANGQVPMCWLPSTVT